MLQHAHRDVDAGVAQLLNAAPAHLGKGVYTPHNHTPHAFSDNEIGTRRSLSVVGARFQTHIHHGFMQQLFVLRCHRSKGIHLCMTFAAAHVIALTNDASTGNYHRPNHRIGTGIAASAGCELQAAAHVHFVCCALVHIKIIKYLCAGKSFRSARRSGIRP